MSGCNVEEYVLLKLSSFLCWAGLVSINLLSFVTKIWLTRFPVLACVQNRDGNIVSPDAVGRLWILAIRIPHFLLGWVIIVSPRSSRNARHHYLYSWSLCFTPPYIAHITTNNLSSTCTPTLSNFTLLEPHICA